jgi:hypothetical protein
MSACVWTGTSECLLGTPWVLSVDRTRRILDKNYRPVMGWDGSVMDQDEGQAIRFPTAALYHVTKFITLIFFFCPKLQNLSHAVDPMFSRFCSQIFIKCSYTTCLSPETCIHTRTLILASFPFHPLQAEDTTARKPWCLLRSNWVGLGNPEDGQRFSKKVHNRH